MWRSLQTAARGAELALAQIAVENPKAKPNARRMQGECKAKGLKRLLATARQPRSLMLTTPDATGHDKDMT